MRAISLFLLPMFVAGQIEKIPPSHVFVPKFNRIPGGVMPGESPTTIEPPTPAPLFPPPPGFPGMPPAPSIPPPNLDSPLSKRVMSSMADLPTVITSQFQGNTAPLKKMIANMLGQGLLSKLITSPVEAAEDMGMPLEDLGFNRTKALNDLKNVTSVVDVEGFLGLKTTSPVPTTTTEKVMYIEGKPIKDFDAYIRQYNPKTGDGQPLFHTRRPAPTTTTQSPESLAEAVARALEKSQAQRAAANGRYYQAGVPIGMDGEQMPADLASSIDMNMIDPSRVNEVNGLLRRSPNQRAHIPIGIGNPDTLTPVGQRPLPMGGMDGSSMAELDPLNVPAAAFDSQIQHVVNTLRTKSVNSMSVGQVKELQAVLQNFEQTVKTKELFQKKRELQALQNRLEEQRDALDRQRQKEVELKMKEQQLREEHEKMQRQLQMELSSFQSGFDLPVSNDIRRSPSRLSSPPAAMSPDFETRSLLADALQADASNPKLIGPTFPETLPSPHLITPMSIGASPPKEPSMFEIGPVGRPLDDLPAPSTQEAAPPAPPPRSAGPLGMSMGMSIVRKQPLPASRMEKDEEEEEHQEPQEPQENFPPAKSNPFEHVRYNSAEEAAKLEYDEADVAEAPRASSHGSIRQGVAGVHKSRSYSDFVKRTTTTTSTTASPDLEEEGFGSQCECIDVSMERMVGSWVVALSSPNLVKKAEEAVGLLFEEERMNLECVKIEFSVPKKSISAQDSKMALQFRTTESSKIFKLRGSGLSMDHRTVRAQLKDLHGNKLTVPFCVLKAEGRGPYEYMVVVHSAGPCNEAMLLIRNADTFFDGSNSALIKYFKHKISRKELDPLEAVSFASDCSAP